MVSKVTDPLKKVTDPVLLSSLAKAGIDPEYVEFIQDYAMPAVVNGVKEKGKSPYAKFYHDRKSNKGFMVTSGLPMVDADGNKNIAGWDDNGSLKNPRYTEKNNLFKASVDSTKVTLQVKNDQPDGRKQGGKLTYQAKLYLDNLEVLPANTDATRLSVDPTNENYANNVLEWDYGICKRRLRIIEGSLLGSWVFDAKPSGTVLIKYNQYGDYKLRLGRFAISDDEEQITPDQCDELAKLQGGYPVTINDSATFYPETANAKDGLVGNETDTQTWADKRNGAGTMVSSAGVQDGGMLFCASATTDRWFFLYRAPLMFDTAALPDNADISAATLSQYGSSNYLDQGSLHVNLALNIYACNPTDPSSLAATDFNIAKWGSTQLSTSIGYDSWNHGDPGTVNNFALNATGIALISLTGVSQFGNREAYYDATGNTPAWTKGAWAMMQAWSAEKGAGYKPKLVVTYTIDTTVTPGTLALVITTYAPTVSVTTDVTVRPTTLALAITLYAPTGTDPILVTVPTLALALTTYIPIVSTPVLATPSTLGLTLTTYIPTVLTPRLVTPSTLSVALTIYTPKVTINHISVPEMLMLGLKQSVISVIVKNNYPDAFRGGSYRIFPSGYTDPWGNHESPLQHMRRMRRGR